MHMYPCWLYWIKGIGNKESRAFLPCLVDLKHYPLGSMFLQDTSHVASCTSQTVSATFLPRSHTLPSWWASPGTPRPPRPAEASSSLASAAQRCCWRSHPFNWHTAVLSQFIVEKLLYFFFFFKPLRIKFEPETFFFLFCSFFFM